MYVVVCALCANTQKKTAAAHKKTTHQVLHELAALGLRRLQLPLCRTQLLLEARYIIIVFITSLLLLRLHGGDTPRSASDHKKVI